MLDIDEKELTKQFYENLPIRQIARFFNTCPRTIYKRIDKLGLQRDKIILFEDISGQKFSKITAIKYIKNDKFGKALWLCKCDCGREKILNASSLKAGLTTSCGCNKSKYLRRNGYESISHTFWKKLARSALSRDYDFTITIEQAWDKYIEQEKKCALSGVDITIYPDSNRERLQTASPDRINSELGYTFENFQWVHKRVNRLKNILSNEEILFWCRLISENNKEKPLIYLDTNILTWD